MPENKVVSPTVQSLEGGQTPQGALLEIAGSLLTNDVGY